MTPSPPNASHWVKRLNDAFLLVAEETIERSCSSEMQPSRYSVRIAHPNSRNAYYGLFFRL